ncbi:MAG TPA: hypothetical protein VIT21_07605 [Chthoniobacterales bacterium]
MKKIGMRAAAVAVVMGLTVPTSAFAGVGYQESAGRSGGRKWDFESTPNMIAPYYLLQQLKGFEGTATASLSYLNGVITKVSMLRSSGYTRLDAAIMKHVKANYRVKAGRSGTVTLPIEITL